MSVGCNPGLVCFSCLSPAAAVDNSSDNRCQCLYWSGQWVLCLFILLCVWGSTQEVPLAGCCDSVWLACCLHVGSVMSKVDFIWNKMMACEWPNCGSEIVIGTRVSR